MKSTAIKIGAKTYSIASIEDELFDLILSQKGITDFDVIKSFVDYDEQVIFIRLRLGVEYRKELAIHELLHACIADSGLEQTEETENLIAILSPRLNSLFEASLKEILEEL